MVSIKAMIPAKTSPDNLVMNKTIVWSKSNNAAKRELLPRVIYVVGGSALALVSFVYNLTVFLIKLPVTSVRLIFGRIKTKNGRFADRFPSDTTVKALFWHAYKVVICLVDVILTPTLGLVHPRAHNWVHIKMHILIETKEFVPAQLPPPTKDSKLEEGDSKEVPPPLEVPPPPPLPQDVPPPPPPPAKSTKTSALKGGVAIGAGTLQAVKLKNAEERVLPSSPKSEQGASLANAFGAKAHLLNQDSDSEDDPPQIGDEGDGEDDGEWAVNTQTYTRRKAQEFLALKKQREEQERISKQKIAEAKAERDAQAAKLKTEENSGSEQTPTQTPKAGTEPKKELYGGTFRQRMLRRNRAMQGTLANIDPKDLKTFESPKDNAPQHVPTVPASDPSTQQPPRRPPRRRIAGGGKPETTPAEKPIEASTPPPVALRTRGGRRRPPSQMMTAMELLEQFKAQGAGQNPSES